ncbi:hypothetical protein O3U67_07765, partial [Brevundimonas diminuta]|uniref:hypothetical protein n=1 Tax=Brevundimonas diminuta TaxID=293 RepID=UPI0022AFECA1
MQDRLRRWTGRVGRNAETASNIDGLLGDHAIPPVFVIGDAPIRSFPEVYRLLAISPVAGIGRSW